MSIEAMSKAYEALNKSRPFDADNARMQRDAMDALRTAIQQAESEPVARVELIQRGGNAGLATRIVEIYDPLRERLLPGDVLYTHPAPGVPVGQAPSVWNSIQIASWIGSQLMREPSMFERNAVCKFVRSLGRHPTLLKHSPKDTHPAPGVPDDVVRDAERYRWLRRKACVIGKTTYCGEETGQPILDFVNLPDVTEVIRRDSATTLDAAIDAAMQKGGE